MRFSLIAVATASCLCFPAQSQAREDLVTKSIRVKHGAWLADAGASRILRRLLTPKIGSYEVFAAKSRILVKDTKQVAESFAALVAHFDKPPAVAARQLVLDVRFVATRNASLWSKSVAPADPGKTSKLPSDVAILTAKEVATVMSVIQKDAKSEIVRSPKLVALDHQDASVFVGESSPGASKGQGYSVRVVPHIVPGSSKVILDVCEGKKARQALLSSGQTVAFRSLDTAERDVIVFVTPRPIPGSDVMKTTVKPSVEATKKQ